MVRFLIMSDVVGSDENQLPQESPVPLTEVMLVPSSFRPPQIHNHGPGQYCFFCPCHECCVFYGSAPGNRCVESMEPSQPRYGDMGLVNSMRAAAAKREEDRQHKLRAERESTAGAAEAPKKDNDQAQNKTTRTGIKRRRV